MEEEESRKETEGVVPSKPREESVLKRDWSTVSNVYKRLRMRKSNRIRQHGVHS